MLQAIVSRGIIYNKNFNFDSLRRFFYGIKAIFQKMFNIVINNYYR